MLVGIVYPLAVWAIGQVACPHQADGSFVTGNGQVVGSALIGQGFTDKDGNPLPQYFQPRPSDAGTGYDATSSGAHQPRARRPPAGRFHPGFNTVGLDGNPSSHQPVRHAGRPLLRAHRSDRPPGHDRRCRARSTPRTRTAPTCAIPNTVPERAIAYRQLNGLPPHVRFPSTP